MEVERIVAHRKIPLTSLFRREGSRTNTRIRGTSSPLPSISCNRIRWEYCVQRHGRDSEGIIEVKLYQWSLEEDLLDSCVGRRESCTNGRLSAEAYDVVALDLFF